MADLDIDALRKLFPNKSDAELMSAHNRASSPEKYVTDRPVAMALPPSPWQGQAVVNPYVNMAKKATGGDYQ